MPPYMLEELTLPVGNEAYSGTAAELMVRSWLASNGRACALPDVDRSGIDLIVDTSRRAQVKKVVRVDNVFKFWWQSPSSSRKRYNTDTIDIFYQVIMTPLRTLIFEIPSRLVPLTPQGVFSVVTEAVLTNDYFERKRPNFNPRPYCVYKVYNPRLIEHA